MRTEQLLTGITNGSDTESTDPTPPTRGSKLGVLVWSTSVIILGIALGVLVDPMISYTMAFAAAAGFAIWAASRVHGWRRAVLVIVAFLMLLALIPSAAYLQWHLAGSTLSVR